MSKPDCVFEISWEVCNMVGGIHTVLQSKAAQMRALYGDQYVCIGPNIPHPISTHPVFREEIWDDAVYKLIQDLHAEGVRCRLGRWLIPSEPRTLLVGFQDLFGQKDRILARYWEDFGVSSLFGGHDYFEPVLFSHTTALLLEQIHNRLFFPEGKKLLVHGHEWMSSIGLLHLKQTSPEIATVFTTHATILGRSLSSTHAGRPLEGFLQEKPAAEWARQLNVEAKHSVETIVAREADCFTTVSETTSEECKLMLGKAADQVVHNGLSDDIPDHRLLNDDSRRAMRSRLLKIAEEVTGTRYDPAATSIVATSGRYEFSNKGIDLFLEALLDLGAEPAAGAESSRILAFVMCPAGHLQRVFPGEPGAHSTHQLVDPEHDPLLSLLRRRGHVNSAESRVHVVFLPLYLNGTDPSLPETYWELLSGLDLAIFPSWYEPWGYTPHEAISLGIPTITTERAGFGRWLQARAGGEAQKGAQVVERLRPGQLHPNEDARGELKREISRFLGLPAAERARWSAAALDTSRSLRWSELIEGYRSAYALACERAAHRVSTSPFARFRSFSLGNVVAPSPFSHARASVRHFEVTARFPTVERNLREFMDRTIVWKWNPKVIEILRRVDPELWERVGQSTSQFIRHADAEIIKRINSDPELRELFDEVRAEFATAPDFVKDCRRAYFCMEYGINDKLRIYSGGLGILAGDHLKTASDMKMPLAAFGLFYQYGYFRQGLGPDGQQLAHYHSSEVEKLNLSVLQDEAGGRLLLSVPFGGETLYFKAWKLDLHGVHLYLLDSNVVENSLGLRNITDRLYASEPGKRISQEWLLSMGGLELIRRLQLPVEIFHMNEGHTAFLVLGRTLDLMREKNLDFDEAFDFVRFTTVFTTHTPVAAGHDEFPLEEAMRLIRGRVSESSALTRVEALGASLKGMGPESRFSMTGLAIRGSRWVNAVSRIHQGVSQQMFNNLYPDLEDREVPVTHVTNGVHVPYWLAPEWQSLFYETLGRDWPSRTCDVKYWRQLEKVPLARFAEIKKALKARLIAFVRKRVGEDLARGALRPECAQALARLDHPTMIIAHAKRMAPYKRADLLLQDPDRLFSLLAKSRVPVLFIYAGKAHPADGHGQEILQRLSHWSRDPRFIGRVLLMEDYDLSYARRLISGADLWLNTPTRPLEASGTSGMKGAINGTLHCSIADGWWPEVYNGRNGWMIGDGSETWEPQLQDSYDRSRIFHLLEHEIFPEFEIPAGQEFSEKWAARIRESIMSALPLVSSERMLAEYDHRLYQPALKAARELSHDNFEKLRRMVGFKRKVRDNWGRLAFESVELDGLGGETVPRAHPSRFIVEARHPELNASDIRVQAVLNRRVNVFEKGDRHILQLECLDPHATGRSRWQLQLDNRHSGHYSLAFRATPQHVTGFEDSAFDLRLVRWM